MLLSWQLFRQTTFSFLIGKASPLSDASEVFFFFSSYNIRKLWCLAYISCLICGYIHCGFWGCGIPKREYIYALLVYVSFSLRIIEVCNCDVFIMRCFMGWSLYIYLRLIFIWYIIKLIWKLFSSWSAKLSNNLPKRIRNIQPTFKHLRHAWISKILTRILHIEQKKHSTAISWYRMVQSFVTNAMETRQDHATFYNAYTMCAPLDFSFILAAIAAAA